MAELHTLLFVSRSCIEKGNEPVAIAAILERGGVRNHELGVTGALMFTGKYFAEVLEGPAASLDALSKSISVDARHTGMVIVERRPITSRLYTRWDMAYHGPSSYVSKRIEPLLDKMEQQAIRELKSLIQGMMEG